MSTYHIYSDGAHETIAVKCAKAAPTIYRKQKAGGTQRYQYTGYQYEAESREQALEQYYDE